MKKICLFVIALTLFLTGCDNQIYNWSFDYSTEDIQEIKIIKFDENEEYTVIKNIGSELFSQVYSDIQSIEMERYGFNLSHPSGYCFLILYNNNDYDIIAKKESKRYRYENGKQLAYNSWLACDETQFNNIIDQYLK